MCSLRLDGVFAFFFLVFVFGIAFEPTEPALPSR